MSALAAAVRIARRPAAQASTREGFDALYRDNRDEVYAYVATLLHDQAAAEDVVARLTDAEAQRRALLRALARARTGTQAEAIRARLRLARQEIAGARSDLRALGQRTSFSTVSVTVSAHGPESTGGGDFGPGAAARDAVRILGAVAGGLVVALAVLLPALLVGGASWFAARGVRRRRREGALDAV